MYLHPLTIGGVTLAHNLVLGPMAGVSDLPFRLLCHEQGSALGVTELISAKAITYRNRNTKAMLETHPDEGTVAIQLFGHEPEVFAEAVRMMHEMEIPDGGAALQDAGGEAELPGGGDVLRDAGGVKVVHGSRRGVRYDILDINMGCPVPKVVSNGEGSALMKKPRLIEEIVRACVQAEQAASIEENGDPAGNGGDEASGRGAESGGSVPDGAERGWESGHASRPVTVKIRSGFDPGHINAVECALAAEAGGASAVAVHARTRDQMYSGKAEWKVIRAVKDAVRIPVIGNGDVTDGKSAQAMMEITGCDGVMVARAAQGNPWVLHEIIHFLKTGREAEKPSAREKLDMVMRHLDLLVQYKGTYVAVREMRGHLAHYTRGMNGAARMRDSVNCIDDPAALKRACAAFFLRLPLS